MAGWVAGWLGGWVVPPWVTGRQTMARRGCVVLTPGPTSSHLPPADVSLGVTASPLRGAAVGPTPHPCLERLSLPSPPTRLTPFLPVCRCQPGCDRLPHEPPLARCPERPPRLLAHRGARQHVEKVGWGWGPAGSRPQASGSRWTRRASPVIQPPTCTPIFSCALAYCRFVVVSPFIHDVSLASGDC